MMFASSFFSTLSSLKNDHSPESPLYKLVNELVKSSIGTTGFAKTDSGFVSFGEYGDLCFPFYSFGNITSLDLFGLDELILFSFYYCNRSRYSNILDIGGNIGLHSILMSKLGWSVSTYEPDPLHCNILARNIQLNQCTNILVHSKAVYNENKAIEFVRVEGNTTGSHIQGMKAMPYGNLSSFAVDCVDINELIRDIDFIKLDAEGAEGKILTGISPSYFDKIDIMAEISTIDNANIVFEFYNSLNSFNIFSQKTGWQRVNCLEDLPTSHREGSVFISSKDSVPFA